ncbi:response regulator [Salimicrobium halophilum]|uniref:Two-component system, response regulator, stage 0 sporulation protein F n=1 Tax=Salimicrobium halophilum TaxID=86666 RepID=A0A1G8WAZ9_9BACI|nr:response regulator [Salimicrobium halophilum]SDJ75366.1 two-component system, response regulator, stage 0 sporulation protein F [Salimicrobium halophilum]
MATVLVIDDESGIQLMLEHFFKSKDWEVRAATNGLEAERMLADAAYDVVLMDYHLPKRSAGELLSFMDERKLDRPVIMTTGFSREEIKDTLEYKQVKGVMEKPFDLEEIFSLAEQLVTTENNFYM